MAGCAVRKHVCKEFSADDNELLRAVEQQQQQGTRWVGGGELGT